MRNDEFLQHHMVLSVNHNLLGSCRGEVRETGGVGGGERLSLLCIIDAVYFSALFIAQHFL